MSNTASAEKLKALKLTIDKIDKDYGKGSVMMLGDKTSTTTRSYKHRFNWIRYCTWCWWCAKR